jgi:hypothetical protein
LAWMRQTTLDSPDMMRGVLAILFLAFLPAWLFAKLRQSIRRRRAVARHEAKPYGSDFL